MQAAAEDFTERLRSLQNVRVLGAPCMNLVAFHWATASADVFDLADALRARDYHLQPQLQTGRWPAALHVSLNARNLEHTDGLFEALNKEMHALTRNPPESEPVDLESILGDRCASRSARFHPALAQYGSGR